MTVRTSWVTDHNLCVCVCIIRSLVLTLNIPADSDVLVMSAPEVLMGG